MTRLLLDSNALLWWLDDSPRLGAAARQAIAEPGSEVCVSIASIWELAIKRASGKLAVSQDIAAACQREHFALIPIEPLHAEQAASLPMHHRDPFDRMLVAQAQAEGLIIVTADAALRRYGVRTMPADE